MQADNRTIIDVKSLLNLDGVVMGRRVQSRIAHVIAVIQCAVNEVTCSYQRRKNMLSLTRTVSKPHLAETEYRLMEKALHEMTTAMPVEITSRISNEWNKTKR